MAKLIETATTPLRSVEVDVITLDLVENGLRNARYEMDVILFRTALSPGIREQHDEFPLIANREGKMVVGQFGLSVPDFLENFDGTIEEGDVLLTSDPYSCGGAISHANDWLVVMPIYFEGRIIGWSAMFGHMTDVGGKTPASMPTDAKTIFEEGVVIPPFRLYKKGVLDDDALRIILNQVRTPVWNRADLNGLVAACRTAGRRVQEMCARFGVDTFDSALTALLDRNYDAMKILLAMVFKDGETISFTDYVDDDGRGHGPYELKLSLTNHGIGRIFDLFGGLLGQTNPANLIAAGFSSSPHFMYSGNYTTGPRKGEWFQLYSVCFGGIPGRPVGDGPDGHSLWPSFVNIPCEYLESYYPLRIERLETIADSGGAGLHRGGNGVEVEYFFLEPGTIAVHDDRWLTYPWGVNGGEPGARGRKWIQRANGTKEVLPSKFIDVPVFLGDVLHYITWGGGGWGDALLRDPQLVSLEVRRGLVTSEGALRYGVVCDENGVLDDAATKQLRDKITAGRVYPLPTFNMGPPLATILERAFEETGLHAPMKPVPLF